ncbi:MAG TPA: transglycosylase SLT domain-containing protein [Vicinamibacterales bacterium]|jgi:soluble lytic murein transglycosylase|nr:transglycosylase SLT domain-containing protein [Vicinamibacterales bacterium]
MSRPGVLAVTLVATLILPTTPRAQEHPANPENQANPANPGPVLRPTEHPRLPADAAQYWLAPSVTDMRAAKAPAMTQFSDAVKLEVDSNFTKALPILSQRTLQQGPLSDYALYYQGLAELRVGHSSDARRTFQALAAKTPVGYLVEGAALREAECDEALGDQPAALAIYEHLSKIKTTAPDDVLMRLARMAKATGDTEKAAAAYSRVLYEFPFSDTALAAATELGSLPLPPLVFGSARYKLELGRGERLFGAKRYTAARPVFDALRRLASGDDRELVDLRLAECEYFLKRTRAARDGVKPYVEKASRQGEALFFYAIATRDLGDHAEYLRAVRRVVNEFPNQSWAEEALNNLATYYILQSDDEEADAAFREMYRKFPTGHYAERAGWKVGWWAYRNDRYADTIAAFESAAGNFPRSDYRPSWLYWSGRAHEALKDRALADARYALVATDYLNSYYGRLAAARLVDHGEHLPQRRLVADAPAGSPDAPAAPAAVTPQNEPVVRALLSLALYDQAVDELRFAQKAWGDSPVIQATFGWIYNQRGDLRAGINAMKRAYPQYLAAGGEQIPTALLRVRFPVNYWPQIQKYSAERGLDPYMMAALIAQESNFTADIRSPANAYGLMQLLPATGRYYARTLSLNRKFTVAMLKTADTNLRMGTAYFADLVKQFGGAHYALATYNAGPNRVARWISERPGVDRDEFIDGIPFPETQDYVKKIIGQAEDYRRLYGPGAVTADASDVAPPAVPPQETTPTPTPQPKGKSATTTKSKAKSAHTAKKSTKA